VYVESEPFDTGPALVPPRIDRASEDTPGGRAVVVLSAVWFMRKRVSGSCFTFAKARRS